MSRSLKESKLISRLSMPRIIKAKRSIQSNEDKTSSQGKLQISGSLFSSNVTEALGKDQAADLKKDTKSATGSLFNFSNQATAGAGATFALTTGGASLFGGNSTFKFQPAATTAAGASSVFSGGSLFGGPGLGAAPGSLFGGGSLFSQTGASTGAIFGAAGGSQLFSNNKPLFGGLNALHAAPKKAEGDEEEDYGDDADDADQPDNEPPAFSSDQTANLIPGVTDKPVKLNIVSKPPEKSPYTKLFNVSHHTFKGFSTSSRNSRLSPEQLHQPRGKRKRRVLMTKRRYRWARDTSASRKPRLREARSTSLFSETSSARPYTRALYQPFILRNAGSRKRQ